MEYTLYSDGSALGNPGPGGYGVVLKSKSETTEHFGGEPWTTNNRMEIMGVLEGLKIIEPQSSVHIVSDSQYVLNAISKWLEGWASNNFCKRSGEMIANDDLWREYWRLIKDTKPKITVEWVRGHNGHIENERCDFLAKQFAGWWKKINIPNTPSKAPAPIEINVPVAPQPPPF